MKRTALAKGAILACLLVCLFIAQRAGAVTPVPTPAAFLPLVAKQSGGPMLGNCPMLPADNIWNRRIDSLAILDQAVSDAYIRSIGASTTLHPDFSSSQYGGPYGIPFTTVPGTQPAVTITSFTYADQSDPGPYRIPSNAPVEIGSDHHVLVVDTGACTLMELWDATQLSPTAWQAGSGAIFNLGSNALRPDGWTSADAAGLPILPGLVRYDEVAAGAIRHAIRFTAAVTRNAHVWPARHDASSNSDPNTPPMGARFRLKASVDISHFDAQSQVIFRAFKEYGLILADNGSSWYISGAPDERWNDDLLHNAFGALKGSDFEYVDTSSLMIDPDSGQAR